MTDDLVKRLRVPDPCCEEHHTQNEAADRIEQLEREAILDAKLLADTQALLDTALEALRAFKDFDDMPTSHKRPDVFELRVRRKLLSTLAEIEGGKKDE